MKNYKRLPSSCTAVTQRLATICKMLNRPTLNKESCSKGKMRKQSMRYGRTEKGWRQGWGFEYNNTANNVILLCEQRRTG